MKMKNVLICGLGAIGTVYAEKLQYKCNLKIVADEKRQKKYKNHLPICNGKELDLDFISPDKVFNADIIIITTKSTQLDSALEDLKNFVNNQTIIISLINGITVEKKIANKFPNCRVYHSYYIGGSCIKEGNIVTQTSSGKIVISKNNKDLQEFFQKTSLEYEEVSDIVYSTWVKFGVNIILNQPSAIWKQSVGDLRNNPEYLPLANNLLEEVYEIAKIYKLNNLENFKEDVFTSAALVSDEGKTSMLQDVLSKRPTEIDIFAGEIIRLGEKFGISVEHNKKIYDQIKQIEHNYPKNIAFIPVRGGSKSIPLKNIKDINGKPLIYWTAKAASEANCVDKVIIATDSNQIKEKVLSFNLDKVEVYDRDPRNAQDTSSTESVMLEYLQHSNVPLDSKFILIQATSPLLKSKHIDEMYKKLIESDADSIFSGVREKQFHWIETESGIKPINYDYQNRPRRQDFKGIIVENGACYINSVDNVIKDCCRLSGKIETYEMPEETKYELDSESDWIVVESLMQSEYTRRINVAFGASVNWLEYTSITIASILDHAFPNEEYHFYIISNEFTNETKELFYRLDKIKKANYYFLKVNDSDFEGASHDWLGVSASYRLKLPSITDIDKVLYLDSDVIALQNIWDLYSKDISNYYLAAVEDKQSHDMKHRMKLTEKETFINSGVMLLNLEKFREEQIEEKIFEKLRDSDFYTDQDVINDICREKILSLPLKYNIMNPPIDQEKNYTSRRKEAEIALESPVIFHHICKPWDSPAYSQSQRWVEYHRLVNGYE